MATDNPGDRTATATGLRLCEAQRAHIPLILALIRELAQYEQLADEVVATEEVLEHWLFDRQGAQVLLLFVCDEPVGYVLYFKTFSTFLGRGGLYVEDLYVRPPHRGMGFGKQTLIHLAREAVAQGCGRLEWACLDWNEPSLAFYQALGAQPLNGWTTHRLEGETLQALAKGE